MASSLLCLFFTHLAHETMHRSLVILEAGVAVVEREQQPVEELLRTAVRWQVEFVRARVDLGQDAGLHVVVAQPGDAYSCTL